MSRDCPSQNKSFKCNTRHHISICNSHWPPPSDKPQSKEAASQPDKSSPESAPIVMFIGSKTPILLQTAQAIINQTGSAQHGRRIRIILDSGSQRSYVTNHLKEELKLPVDHQEAMLIRTFGSKGEKSQTCDVIRFSIKFLDGKDMQLSAYSVPLICEPLTNQTVALAKNMYDHLSGLYLADYLTETTPARRVAKVSIGVFVEPQILLSAGGVLTRGVRGHAPPETFENLGSQKPHFLDFETHFRQITTLFYSSFLSYKHHFDSIIVST